MDRSGRPPVGYIWACRRENPARDRTRSGVRQGYQRAGGGRKEVTRDEGRVVLSVEGRVSRENGRRRDQGTKSADVAGLFPSTPDARSSELHMSKRSSHLKISSLLPPLPPVQKPFLFSPLLSETK